MTAYSWVFLPYPVLDQIPCAVEGDSGPAFRFAENLTDMQERQLTEYPERKNFLIGLLQAVQQLMDPKGFCFVDQTLLNGQAANRHFFTHFFRQIG
ncbi:hypothetical protein D3C75_888520 [compost metagenome]